MCNFFGMVASVFFIIKDIDGKYLPITVILRILLIKNTKSLKPSNSDNAFCWDKERIVFQHNYKIYKVAAIKVSLYT